MPAHALYTNALIPDVRSKASERSGLFDCPQRHSVAIFDEDAIAGEHWIRVGAALGLVNIRLQSAPGTLLSLVVRDLRKRANSPSLRAWAPAGTRAAGFLEATGGAIVRHRWKVGPGDMAVRGVVYGWRAVPAVTAAPRDHALA